MKTMTTRFFWGFRFYGNRRTTYGIANLRTGRCDIAGELQAFASKRDLNNWLSEENMSAPCGCDGGERIQVTLLQARKLRSGCTTCEFHEELDCLRKEALSKIEN